MVFVELDVPIIWVVGQNVDRQNVDKQNVDRQNVDRQNTEQTICR